MDHVRVLIGTTESGSEEVTFDGTKDYVHAMVKCRPVDGELDITMQFLKGEDVLNTMNITSPRPIRESFALGDTTLTVNYTITHGMIQFVRLM